MKKTLFTLLVFCAVFISRAQLLQQGVVANQEISFVTPPGLPIVQPTQLLASINAEGFGAQTTGGKDGKPFFVTSLSSASTGSYDPTCDCFKGTLRYAMESNADGYVFMRVGGLIQSPSTTTFYINDIDNGNKTIIGASAPFPGIAHHGSRFQVLRNEGNWIIRGITSVVGDVGTPGIEVPMSISPGDNVFMSDINAGWGNDQAFDIIDSKSGTAQRVFAFECHPDHNTGGIHGGNTGTIGTGDIRYTGQNTSTHHCAYAHISHRFPNFASDGGRTDIVNQIAYNYGSRLSRGNCDPRVNHINNYYKPGSRSGSYALTKLQKYSTAASNSNCNISPRIYTAGNIVEGHFTNPLANNNATWTVFINGGGFNANDPLLPEWFSAKHPEASVPITIETAQEAFDDLIVNENVGSRYYTGSDGKPVYYRLPFVQAYLDDIKNGTELAYLNDETQFTVANMNVPSGGTAYLDSDFDGLPDTFEDRFGLDKNNYLDAREMNKVVWNFNNFTFINNINMRNWQVFEAWVNGDFVLWAKNNLNIDNLVND